ncbi:MAG: O-antigen ligase family protein [Candidatus Cloacimonadota bacterium]|nr:O-antigen ligase family protein [Candidatus Cloacimonadota bacterium]
MIFFTARMEDINFISHEFYRGTSRGFEVGMVDIMTFIIFLLIIHRRKRYPIKLFPPGSILYFIYFFFSFLSIVNATLYLEFFFEIWKMIRMYAYFWVIYNYINSYNKFEELMKDISIIIIFIGIIVLKQKYVDGIFQTYGPFPHQNSLVMYLVVFNSLILAYIMNKRRKIKLWYWLGILGLGTVSVISTFSRAGLLCYAIAMATVLFFSFLEEFSIKKILITFMILVLGLIVLIRAMDSILERFQTAPEASANTRILLAQSAVNMANDKTLGIGLNNFGLKVNLPYSYSDHIEGMTEETRNGLVETIYLMIAAETGWHNLVIFMIMIFWFYFRNFISYVRYRNTDIHYLTIGIVGGLLGIYLESSLEWVLKQTNNFYQLMLIFAIIVVFPKLERRYKRLQLRRRMYHAA